MGKGSIPSLRNLFISRKKLNSLINRHALSVQYSTVQYLIGPIFGLSRDVVTGEVNSYLIFFCLLVHTNIISQSKKRKREQSQADCSICAASLHATGMTLDQQGRPHPLHLLIFVVIQMSRNSSQQRCAWQKRSLPYKMTHLCVT